jgi:hypothetical protein
MLVRLSCAFPLAFNRFCARTSRSHKTIFTVGEEASLLCRAHERLPRLVGLLRGNTNIGHVLFKPFLGSDFTQFMTESLEHALGVP